MTGQYYLRVRYYNPVIARFPQEDTYYGDGLNIYTYCRNNLILNHDPTGHGTKENSPYSRKEQQYIDAGADPDTAKLATQCYPDAKSKQDLYNKYKSQGYNATDAKKLANYEIVHGEERAKNYAANNVKKSGPDYTPTSPRDNVNTDWRTQNRLNAQKKAGAGKTSYGKSSGKIGDFTELEGSTVDEILDRIPDEAVLRELYPVQGGATEGFEFKWVQNGQTYRVRVHNVDPSAPVGSNAYNGWVVRVQRGRRYFDPTINDFREAKYFNPNGPDYDEVIINDTHIPILDPYQN